MVVLAQAFGVLLLLAVALWIFGILVTLILCASTFITANAKWERRFAIDEAKAAWKWPFSSWAVFSDSFRETRRVIRERDW